MSEVPFKIAIPDDRLDLLRKKLTLATFPDEHEDAPRGQAYTAPLADIQRLAAYWKDGFDWRKAEARLNAALPQFTRDIDVEGFGTFNIHYVHQKSGLEEAIPLLFVHGCKSLSRSSVGSPASHYNRARSFHGGPQYTSVIIRDFSRSSQLPCRRLESAWLRVFYRSDKDRVHACQIRRGYSLLFQLIDRDFSYSVGRT